MRIVRRKKTIMEIKYIQKTYTAIRSKLIKHKPEIK